MRDEESIDELETLLRDMHHICGYYLAADRTRRNTDHVNADLWRIFWRYTAFVARGRCRLAQRNAQLLAAAVREPVGTRH